MRPRVAALCFHSDSFSSRRVLALIGRVTSTLKARRKDGTNEREREKTHSEGNLHAGVQQRRVQVIVGFLQEGHKVGSLCAHPPQHHHHHRSAD